MDLQAIDGVVMDMDGVLWRGNEPMPGLVRFFNMLHAKDIPYVLATNNSRQSRAAYIDKLSKMGVEGVAIDRIITSGTATARYMQERYPVGSRVYMIGGDGLRGVLLDAGYEIADYEVVAVVAGIDFELTYDKLRRATLLIRGGADFIGTNPDVTFPTPVGLAPGAGSILAALVASTDVEPHIIGKPAAPMFEQALKILGTAPEKTLMIGDRLGTDILGGNNAGMKTALLLTGVSTREELPNSDIQPDWVFEGLLDLIEAWGEDIE